MPAAELIAIGTELLLGEIQDTNTRYLARTLRDLGIDIYRATMVGDNIERIAQAVREAMERCQIIITTGGLGPTVDDATRAAIAMALGVDTEFRPELWEQIQARFSQYGRKPSENNRRQAWIPEGSIPVKNPVGTAPSFICETINACIISLPGVPREMEYLIEHAVIPYLRERFQLSGTIKARVLHVAGVGESQVDEWIGDLETNPNPTVGLLAHPGQVDVRITAKAESMDAADQMIADMEARVRERIQEGIFGQDQDTLEEAVLRTLHDRGYDAAMIECGLGGALLKKVERARFPGKNVQVIAGACTLDELRRMIFEMREQLNVEVGLGISLEQTSENHLASLVMITPQEVYETVRSYGGEQALAAPWAVNTGLEMMRRNLIDK